MKIPSFRIGLIVVLALLLLVVGVAVAQGQPPVDGPAPNMSHSLFLPAVSGGSENVVSTPTVTPAGPTPTATAVPPTSTPTATPAGPALHIIAGYVQKGPFVQGTSITVRELNESFTPTGRAFAGSIDDNAGHFTVRGALLFPFVELEAAGFYFNEVSSSLSAAPISLRALADLRDSTSINVNLLTHLEYARVLALVDGGMAFSVAKAQAQQEVLAVFNIVSGGIGGSETLDISRPGDGNAILLAISAVLQSNRSEAQLTELLSTLANDLSTDGVLDLAAAHQALVNGMEYIKPRRAAIRTNVANRYAELGVPASVPAFEPYAFALDTVVPAVTLTAPVDGADLEVHNVTVVFSDLMQHTTLASDTVQVIDAANRTVSGALDANDEKNVTRLVFTPFATLAPGAHRLTVSTGVRDLAGNTPVMETTISFTHTPLSALTASNQGPVPLGSVVMLTAAVPGNSSHVIYTWALGDGAQAVGDVVSHTYAAVGAYVAAVTATNGAEQAQASTDVNVIDRAIEGLTAANSGPTRLVSATHFTATLRDGSNVGFFWSFGDGAIGSGSVISHTYAAVGNYMAIVTATNGVSQVMAMTEASVTNLSPVADAGEDQIAVVEQVVTLDGTASEDPDGHIPLQYRWTQHDGPPITLSDPAAMQPNFIAPSSPSVITFTLNVTDSCSLANAAPAVVVVTVLDRIINGLAAANDGPTILGNTTAFSATLLDGTNVVYAWDFGDGSHGSGASANHTYTGIGPYTAIVTGTNGVSQVKASTVITVVDRSISGLQISRNGHGAETPNKTLTFTATVYAGSNVGYQWTFGDGSVAGGPVVTHSYAVTDSYTVIVTATNSVGSSAALTSVVILDGWTQDEILIPTGSFQMGCDLSNPAEDGCIVSEQIDELPLHTVTLDAYYIDKYEVTNARYQACVVAGGCRKPALFGSRTRDPYYGTTAYANYPVIGIMWDRAAAFCAWEGKHLPTEAEWERAARGSSDTRKYPWGDSEPDCTLANFNNVTGGAPCVGDTSQVGAYPAGASVDGVLDMAGNVEEWVNDRYSSTYYGASPANNPPGPATGDDRVLRGGSHEFPGDGLRTASRRGKSDYWYSFGSGFRCVRLP